MLQALGASGSVSGNKADAIQDPSSKMEVSEQTYWLQMRSGEKMGNVCESADQNCSKVKYIH